MIVVLLILPILFWILSIICNSIEDTLQYYYDRSIFDWIPKNTWWSWYMVDPDTVWRRKYDENGKLKKWAGIPIPPLFFDGWHGFKVLRQFFQYLTFYFGVTLGYNLSNMDFYKWFVWFILFMLIFAITNYITHEIYFFKGLLLKKWWLDRNKENKIKKFLGNKI